MHALVTPFLEEHSFWRSYAYPPGCQPKQLRVILYERVITNTYNLCLQAVPLSLEIVIAPQS